MNLPAIATDLKRQFIDGEPMTERGIIALMVVTLFAFLAIPFAAISSSHYASVFSFRSAAVEVSAAKPEIQPVLVASAEQAGAFVAPLTADLAPALKEPEEIVHPVQDGQTLIGILKAYCRDDYEVVARENGIDPHWIYANKTVLKFKNGCSSNAPSVFVHKRVSPRELVRNGEASSGKHISRTEATRAPITAPAVAFAASAPTPSALAASAAQSTIASVPTTVVQIRPAERAASQSATNAPADVAAVVDDRPLAVIYHREIYRIAALRGQQIRGEISRAGLAEMNRLQLKIRAAQQAKFPLKNADCLYDGKLSSVDRLRCIRENYGETIAKNLKQYPHISQSFVEAVILVESGGRPDAISETGCTGVKQFTMGSARKFNLRDRLDPYEGIRAGIDHLADNLRMWGNNVAKATAHYNIGSVVVSQKGFDANAFQYTRAVLWAKWLVEKELHPGANAPALPLIAPRNRKTAHAEKDRVSAAAVPHHPVQAR